MGHTVCFANNKGGVGKTTTCVAIGQAWARMGKKVLFVDLDSQANLTSIVTPKPESASQEELEEESVHYDITIRDAFIDKDFFTIYPIEENIDLVPSSLTLSHFDRDTAAITGREYLLLDLLNTVKDKYDFILIDCPPALGLITINAFIAAEHVVMVTTPDSLSYEGMKMVSGLFKEVKSKARLNVNLKLTGVVITKYERNKVSDLFVTKITKELNEYFIGPVIRKATKIQQAVYMKMSIYEHDNDGKAAKDYFKIAQQLALRILQ